MQNLSWRGDESVVEIKVPEPAAFILNKFFISDRHINKEKAKKDIQIAKEFLNLLLSDDRQRENLKIIFKIFPEGWKKTLRKIFLKMRSK